MGKSYIIVNKENNFWAPIFYNTREEALNVVVSTFTDKNDHYRMWCEIRKLNQGDFKNKWTYCSNVLSDREKDRYAIREVPNRFRKKMEKQINQQLKELDTALAGFNKICGMLLTQQNQNEKESGK